MHAQPVTAVVAPAVVVAAGTAAVLLVVAPVVAAVVAPVAASGRPAALSAPEAMAVQRAQQVAAGES